MIGPHFRGGRSVIYVLCVAGLIAGSPADVSAKTNVVIVVMKNGDRITGELKKVENGFLYFKAQYMADTTQLDWTQVERLESVDTFSVVLANGARETGLVEKSPEPNAQAEGFLVRSSGQTISARSDEVVRITPVEDTFLHQLTGSVNYGFNFTSGSTIQSNFSGDVTYRSERWAGLLRGSSIFNRQNQSNSGRNTLEAFYYNYRGERWFIAGTASFLNSLQQDLAARSTVGSGIGLDVIRRSRESLQLIGGALFYNEVYSTATGARSDRGSDGQFLVQYTRYAFTKFQFRLQTGIFPGLSTALGRVRYSVESDLRWDLWRNFTLLYSVYENYDSRPPVHANKNDFGTSTSLGWTF